MGHHYVVNLLCVLLLVKVLPLLLQVAVTVTSLDPSFYYYEQIIKIIYKLQIKSTTNIINYLSFLNI